MKILNRVSISALVVLGILGITGPITAFAVSPATVNLGSAGNFVILAKTGVSTTGATSIVGNVGISPAAASYITGFALNLSAGSTFAKSSKVVGEVYAPNYAAPVNMARISITTSVSDMETAYTDAAGRASTVTELGAGNIGGLTLVPGVYKWSTGLAIPTDVTLSGSANDVWIFQIAQNLNLSSATKIVLAGGAQASNIFWQVAGQTTIGTTAVFNGNILDQTAIVLNTGAVLNGRALAQTAVTLDANIVTTPNDGPAPGPEPATSTPATPAVPATPANNSSVSNTTIPSSGLSTSQIQSILDVLASFNADASVLANVRASLGGATTGSTISVAVHVFKANLTIGSLGSEVKALQEFLNAHGYTVATNGAGSPGNETTRFGSATKAALMKYQRANGIIPVSGYFGPLTRTAINTN